MSSIQIKENVSLKPYNSFGIDEICAYGTSVAEVAQLTEALHWADAKKIPVLILGGGSNILLTKPFTGLAIRIVCKGKKIRKETNDHVWVEVAAGENWNEFVLSSLAQGWYGLENLTLIPGHVGAAPMQNIGAYGAEAKDFIEEVSYYDRGAGMVKTLLASECHFGYRESVFKHDLKDKAVICSVTFRLSKVPQLKIEYGDIRNRLAEWNIHDPSPQDVSNAVAHIRKSKLPDPAETGNAGSFFKNPVIGKADFVRLKERFHEMPHYPVDDTQVKVPAGWLIETAGWKGKTLDGYGVHKRQALVLVNYGTAKGAQILALAREIQADIKGKFGIDLQMEVNIL